MSDFYRQLHARHGVTIRTGATVTRFEGDTRLRHAIIGGAQYRCDLALIGIGIAPATELAHAAGIACDRGILIDAQCRTSAPNVYAAGDCTHHMNEMLGRRVHVESVPNAIEQAKVAAANLAGRRSSHAAVPWFWSDQYGLKLQMAGFSTDADSHVVRGDPGNEAFAVFYLSGDRLVAVEAVNSPREFMAGRLFYGRRIDAAGLADTGVDIKSLLRDECTH
jgi:3-phenylpropionate/trans-cinnamate dioxygenase ferredoxin reductase component